MNPTTPTHDIGQSPVDSSGAVPDPQGVSAVRGAVAARLDQHPGTLGPDELDALVRAETTAWAQRQAAAGAPPPDWEAEEELVRAVQAALSGLGPLQPLLERADVENIHLHGCDQVWLERADGTLEQSAPVADSDRELLELLAHVFAHQGQTSREFTAAHPLGTLRLSAGGALGARLAAVREIADRPRAVIRRHRLVHTGLAELAALGTLDEPVLALLRAAVRAGCTLLVTGGPAVGKTTLLRALAADIPQPEHVITVEDDAELGLHIDTDRPLVTPLEAREANAEGAGALGLDALLAHALRLSPHRVLVGEVRGGEITALPRAWGNGAAGGMSTLHARSAEAVPDRIAALAQLADPPLPPAAAHQRTAGALDLVVHLTRRDTRTADGAQRRQRWVAAVREIGPVGAAGRPDTTLLFRADVPGGTVCVFPPSPELGERLQEGGLDPSVFGTSPLDWGWGPW